MNVDRTIAATTGRRTSLASLKVGRVDPVERKWPDTIKFAEMADNPDNPRETLRALDELADSIREVGILQRLVVVPRAAWLEAHPDHSEAIGDKPWVLLIGHRRRHAAEMAGLSEAPVEVQETAATRSRRVALIENVQRDDLSPMEQAHAIRDLMDEEGITQAAAAAALGKTPAWVSQRLALLGLIPSLQEAVEDGRLKVEDARRIGKLPPQEQALPVAKPSEPRSVPDKNSNSRLERPEPAIPKTTPRESPSTDDDGLDEALRIEGAANVIGDPRVLRRVAQRQPERARKILALLEMAADRIRTELGNP